MFTTMLSQIKKSKKIIAYKIISNLLVTIIIVWIAGLIAEVLIPGFISAYFNFSKIILISFILVLIIYILGKDFEITDSKNLSKTSKWTIAAISIFSIIILSISAFDTPIIPLLITTFTFLTILFFILKELKIVK